MRAAATSGREAEQDARLIAELAYDYLIRRSRIDPLNWPQPQPDHIERHAQFLLEQRILHSKYAVMLIEDKKQVVAAGIGEPVPSTLAFTPSLSPCFQPESQFCQLDDFFVRAGEDWSCYGPTLFAAIRDKILNSDEELILGFTFVQNILDEESIEFSGSLGFRPFHEFYLLRS